jgi:hypothetical protein
MNKWRPEEWKNPYKNVTFVGQSLANIFEEGADAVLETLKKKGAWMTPEQMKLLAPDRKYPYGYIVFIPDEKQPVSIEVSEQEGMPLNKAIKVLEHFVESGGAAPSEATRDAAINMGVEALKDIDHCRMTGVLPADFKLPGEIEE